MPTFTFFPLSSCHFFVVLRFKLFWQRTVTSPVSILNTINLLWHADSKSFYAYVRSKQNVRDKVGPLEDNFGNIVTQGFLMAEELNMHFSSVFTREDTSSLPVPETKFKGSEGERLGQLVVTPEVVANKINNMKENKSPGVCCLQPPHGPIKYPHNKMTKSH